MPKHETPNSHEVRPNPKLEKRSRRIFTLEYKLSILKQADACKHGEIGALLHREKLYSNQLPQWWREFAENGTEGLSQSQPGLKPSKTPEQKHIEQLQKENTHLRQQLTVKDSCIDLQKKPWLRSRRSSARAGREAC